MSEWRESQERTGRRNVSLRLVLIALSTGSFHAVCLGDESQQTLTRPIFTYTLKVKANVSIRICPSLSKWRSKRNALCYHKLKQLVSKPRKLKFISTTKKHKMTYPALLPKLIFRKKTSVTNVYVYDLTGLQTNFKNDFSLQSYVVRKVLQSSKK